MQLSILRETLLKPLQFAVSVAERRPSFPVLGNVLLEVTENNELKVTGSDSELEFTSFVSLNVPSSPGAITVLARKFLDICRSLPDGSLLEISVVDAAKMPQAVSLNDSVLSQQVQICCGLSRFMLATLPAAQFPLMPEESAEGEFSVAQNLLLDRLKQTHFAMAQLDVRPYLNGILFDVTPEKLQLVATDGHRLAMSAVSLSATMASQVIVPRKAIAELLKLLNENETPVNLRLSAHQLKVITEDAVLSTKIIDSRFPDYQRVIPRNGNKKIVLDRDKFKQALSRAAILSHEKHRGVRISIQVNSLHISAHNPLQEEAEEELDVMYEGENLEVAFNVGYLIDVLNTVLPGNVILTLNDEKSSLLLQGENNKSAFYVVMPLCL